MVPVVAHVSQAVLVAVEVSLEMAVPPTHVTHVVVVAAVEKAAVSTHTLQTLLSAVHIYPPAIGGARISFSAFGSNSRTCLPFEASALLTA